MLVDTNLLLYASFRGAPEHPEVRRWIGARLRDEGVVLSWPVVYAFVRLASNRRVFGDGARTVAEAWTAAEAYLAAPGVRVVSPGRAHRAIAAELAATPGLRSDDVPDVELAALAIEHGLVLASHDHGFRRFAKLRFLDPLSR